jgi:hypothetical protein
MSERWASRVAKKPAMEWGLLLLLVAVVASNLYGGWSAVTVPEVLLYVLLCACIVYVSIVFEGFRRLLAARDRQIDELKSLRNKAEPDASP